MAELDRHALLNELIKRNERRLIAIARCYTAPSDTADLVQEILLQVWRSLDRFRGEASQDTWFYRVALNVALLWKRSSRRRQRWLPREAIDLEMLGSRSAQDNDAERLVQEFLATLGEIDRALLLLYLDNLTHDTIAQILGLSENAVSVRLHRIRQRFESRYVKD